MVSYSSVVSAAWFCTFEHIHPRLTSSNILYLIWFPSIPTNIYIYIHTKYEIHQTLVYLTPTSIHISLTVGGYLYGISSNRICIIVYSAYLMSSTYIYICIYTQIHHIYIHIYIYVHILYMYICIDSCLQSLTKRARSRYPVDFPSRSAMDPYKILGVPASQAPCQRPILT